MGPRTADPARLLAGDWSRVVLITLLYTLQGVPLGLVHGSLPYLLKKHLSYSDLAIFSLASYPYLFKLFWSPVVDSKFLQSLGRRKSWIVPCQVLMGLTLLFYSPHISHSLTTAAALPTLTLVMFLLILLAATQDIAVDAWALELLLPQNRALGSVCQSVGQYMGFFVSFPMMIAANSAEFSSAYFGTEGALLTIEGFFRATGVIFVAVSIYIQLFLHEDSAKAEDTVSFRAILSQMLEVLKLPHMKDLVLLLLTVRLGLTAFDSVFMLQLTEHGLDEMEMGALSMCLIPVEIAVTVGIGWLLAQRFSLSGYRSGFAVRIIANAFNFTVLLLMPEKNLTWHWYTAIVIGCLVSAVGANMMFSIITSLFFRISQQSMGGTYMTFLATVLNFGAQFPSTIALWAVDLLSHKGTCTATQSPCDKSCPSDCIDSVNGFIPLAAVSLVFSVLYYWRFLRQKTREFEVLSAEDWHYVDKRQ